jgi:hypothetical protein
MAAINKVAASEAGDVIGGEVDDARGIARAEIFDAVDVD